MADVPVVERDGRYDYGNLSYGVPETQPLDFYSPYGCSKGAADQYVRDYARIYGIRTIIFRMSCIYGIRQFGNEDQGWVAHFVISSVFGKPLIIYGDGKQVRDILHIDDLFRLLEIQMSDWEKYHLEVFNVGGGREVSLSLRELTRYCEKYTGNMINIQPVAENRPADIKLYLTDNTKVTECTGWKPQVDAENLVKQTIDWLIDNNNQLESILK